MSAFAVSPCDTKGHRACDRCSEAAWIDALAEFTRLRLAAVASRVALRATMLATEEDFDYDELDDVNDDIERLMMLERNAVEVLKDIKRESSKM